MIESDVRASSGMLSVTFAVARKRRKEKRPRKRKRERARRFRERERMSCFSLFASRQREAEDARAATINRATCNESEIREEKKKKRAAEKRKCQLGRVVSLLFSFLCFTLLISRGIKSPGSDPSREALECCRILFTLTPLPATFTFDSL